MNGPGSGKGRGSVLCYLQGIISTHHIWLLYLTAPFVTAKSCGWELHARRLEERNTSCFCSFAFSISQFRSGLKFVQQCLADFLVSDISVEMSSVHGSEVLGVTLFLVLRAGV